MLLNVENLSYQIDQIQILDDINIRVEKGEFVGIIGPNGSGKSTCLKNIYRVLKPTKGAIYINGKAVSEHSNREIAQELAVVSQEFEYGFEFSVRDIVLMGRYPLKEFYERENEHDEEVIDAALKQVGVFDLKQRSFSTLSGGEKQRVLIARSLAQETEFIIMDEPTNHLDVGYQMKVMDLVCSLGKTVFTAIHDLNMAMLYCDKVVIINHGKIVAAGKPNEILTEELIETIYDVPAHIEHNQFLGRKMIIFKSKHESN